MLRFVTVFLLLSMVGCGTSSEADPVDTGSTAPDAGGVDTGAVSDLGDEGQTDMGTPDEPDMPSADDVAVSVDAGPVDRSPLAVMDRPANVTIPENYDPGTAYPLVVLLHGFGVNGLGQDFYFKLSERTTERGFILVKPDGTQAPDGNRFWNASWCCDFYDQNVDDVAYISGLIAEAKERFNVDAQRVYLFGHSNGGFMSYRMACEVDGIAAIASLAGSGFEDGADCTGTGGPVSVLQIHGTLDITIPYDGFVGRYPSAPEMMNRWVARNNCGPDAVEGTPIDIESTLLGDDTTVQTWSGCDEDTNVELWTIEGGGHIPSLQPLNQPNLTEGVLDFFFAHSSP